MKNLAALLGTGFLGFRFMVWQWEQQTWWFSRAAFIALLTLAVFEEIRRSLNEARS